MTREDALALADDHYIDLFRMIRAAGRKDRDKAKAASLYLAETIIAEAAAMRERAAGVCEQQAKDFLSPQYATGQPLSSFGERFACGQCAEAIRNLPATGEG